MYLVQGKSRSCENGKSGRSCCHIIHPANQAFKRNGFQLCHPYRHQLASLHFVKANLTRDTITNSHSHQNTLYAHPAQSGSTNYQEIFPRARTIDWRVWFGISPGNNRRLVRKMCIRHASAHTSIEGVTGTPKRTSGAAMTWDIGFNAFGSPVPYKGFPKIANFNVEILDWLRQRSKIKDESGGNRI